MRLPPAPGSARFLSFRRTMGAGSAIDCLNSGPALNWVVLAHLRFVAVDAIVPYRTSDANE